MGYLLDHVGYMLDLLTANGRKQIQPNRINKEYAMDSTWKRTQLCPINHCSGFCHDIIRILPGVVILW